MKFLPEYADVEKAHQIVQKFAHRTPVLTSKSINKMVRGNGLTESELDALAKFASDCSYFTRN